MVSRIGQLQVFFTFFFALMIKADLVKNGAALSACLIILNFGVFLMTVFYEVRAYRRAFSRDGKLTPRSSLNKQQLELEVFIIPHPFISQTHQKI